jgi:hypothetical protein
MPGSYAAYMKSIQAKTGKTPDDFYRMAEENGFIRDGKINAKHAELLAWLKQDTGLGHVHANMIIVYLRLRTKDPQLTEGMKMWACTTGYQDGR